MSTLEAAPVREAEFFILALQERNFHLGALVLNRVLPDYLLDDDADGRGARLSDEAAELAGSEELAAWLGTDRGQLTRVLGEVGANFCNLSIVARREAALRSELRLAPDVVATIPEFESDIHDLSGLLRLGERIWA